MKGRKREMEKRWRTGYEEGKKVLDFYSFQDSCRKLPIDDTQDRHDVSHYLIQNPEIP
jgi:hypothetical protein